MKTIQIAIDGPAGVGKSTAAKNIAKKLGYLYIDSGAMYRAIAWKAIQEGIAFDDEENLTRLAQECKLVLEDRPEGYKVYCDDRDISDEIRLPQVGAAASPVSALPGLRRALVAQQKALAAQHNVVMDGRDIGTKVLPEAQYKIFLTASLEERARRRTEDLQNRGNTADFEAVKADIQERDARDSSRADSPLMAAEDAMILDTTAFTAEDTVAAILRLIHTAKEGQG